MKKKRRKLNNNNKRNHSIVIIKNRGDSWWILAKNCVKWTIESENVMQSQTGFEITPHMNGEIF